MIASFYNFFMVYSSIFMINSVLEELPWMGLQPVQMLSSLSEYFNDQIIQANSSNGNLYLLKLIKRNRIIQNQITLV